MKKFNSFLIGVLILFQALAPAAWAQEETNKKPPLTAPEQACSEKLNPQFYVDGVLGDPWKLPSALSPKDYQTFFEKAQMAYHTYIACLFSFAENAIYQTEGEDQEGIGKAGMGNTNAIDWMVPQKACLPSLELKESLKKTDPSQLLGPTLQAYAEYKKYLNELTQYSLARSAPGEGGAVELNTTGNFLSQIEREKQMELDSAMVSLDLMLHSLKELRLSFMIHVHFQCTLKYLGKYRNQLGELRKLIQGLPNQLRDASITK